MAGQEKEAAPSASYSNIGSAPCIFDLCLQLHRSGKIAETMDVTALPGCVGCGACATLCPSGDIRIEDHDGERIITMRGNIVARIAMQKCSGCGAFHAPALLLEQVSKLVEVPKEMIDNQLCPGCKRLALAASMTGNRPDFGWIRRRR